MAQLGPNLHPPGAQGVVPPHLVHGVAIREQKLREDALDDQYAALQSLRSAAAQVRNADGRRVFAIVGGNRGDGRLFTRSRFALLSPDAVARANEELNNNFAPLLDVQLAYQGDIECRNQVFEHINNSSATAKDIRLLSQVVERRTRTAEQNSAVAYRQLQRFAKAASASPDAKSMTFSDKEVDVQFKNRIWMTAKGRREAGQYVKAELAPLRAMIKQRGTEKELKKFDELLALAANGEMKSTQMKDLERLVTRVREPETYSRQTLARLGAMSRQAGGNKSLGYSLHDYSIKNRSRMTKPERLEAGRRLAVELRGLRAVFDQVDIEDLGANAYHNDAAFRRRYDNACARADAHRTQYEEVLQKISRGEAKSDDLVLLEEIVKKRDGALAYAREELRQLHDLALKNNFWTTFRWDSSKMQMTVGSKRRRWWFPDSITKAERHIGRRLDGLYQLFNEDTPLDQAAQALIARVRAGTFTTKDAIHLQQLVDIRTELSSTNPQVRMAPVDRARQYLHELSATPDSGPEVRIRLYALQELYSRPPELPQGMRQFNDVLNVLANPASNPGEIQRSVEILQRRADSVDNAQVQQARHAPVVGPVGAPLAAPVGAPMGNPPGAPQPGPAPLGFNMPVGFAQGLGGVPGNLLFPLRPQPMVQNLNEMADQVTPGGSGDESLAGSGDESVATANQANSDVSANSGRAPKNGEKRRRRRSQRIGSHRKNRHSGNGLERNGSFKRNLGDAAMAADMVGDDIVNEMATDNGQARKSQLQINPHARNGEKSMSNASRPNSPSIAPAKQPRGNHQRLPLKPINSAQPSSDEDELEDFVTIGAPPSTHASGRSVGNENIDNMSDITDLPEPQPAALPDDAIQLQLGGADDNNPDANNVDGGVNGDAPAV